MRYKPNKTHVTFTLNGQDVLAIVRKTHRNYTVTVEALSGNPWMGRRFTLPYDCCKVKTYPGIERAFKKIVNPFD